MRDITKIKKKFPISVSPELHRRFKTKCASEGLAMTAVIRGLLERELATWSEAPSAQPKKKARSDALQAAE